MNAVAEIQGRIAEIRSSMEVLRTGSAASKTTTGTSASTAFADALASAQAAATDAVTGIDSSALAAGATAATMATTAAATAASGAGTGQGLVDAAKKYIGVPYVWGGENPATGLDCSGLVQRAMSDVGVDVPRVARDQAKLGTAVASVADATAGDLLIFDGGTHIGIYIGDGKMIDAPKPGKSVAIRDVFETPTAIRRVLPAASEVSSAATVTSNLTTSADLQRYALSMMSGVAA